MRNPTRKNPKGKYFFQSLCLTVQCQAVIKKVMRKDNRCSFLKHSQSKPLLAHRQFSVVRNWLWWSLMWRYRLQHCTTPSRNRAMHIVLSTQRVMRHLASIAQWLLHFKNIFSRGQPLHAKLRLLHFALSQTVLITTTPPPTYNLTFTKKILTWGCYECLQRPQI